MLLIQQTVTPLTNLYKSMFSAPGKERAVHRALGHLARRITNQQLLLGLLVAESLVHRNLFPRVFVWGSCFWMCAPTRVHLPPPPSSRTKRNSHTHNPFTHNFHTLAKNRHCKFCCGMHWTCKKQLHQTP